MFVEFHGLIDADLSCVCFPLDNIKFKKFGDGFFDRDVINKCAFDHLVPYLKDFRFQSYKFLIWQRKHKDEAWYDLLEDEDGNLFVAAGISKEIRFIEMIHYLTIEYKGYEINAYGLKDEFFFSFWIDPEGGILKASDDERAYDFYDQLEYDEVSYSKKDYTFQSAIDNLISNCDKYQNSCNEETEENENQPSL